MFQSKNRHTYVSDKNISDRWFISLKAGQKTLKNTTQKFLRSALLPLSHRYRTDMMYVKIPVYGSGPLIQ